MVSKNSKRLRHQWTARIGRVPACGSLFFVLVRTLKNSFWLQTRRTPFNTQWLKMLKAAEKLSRFWPYWDILELTTKFLKDGEFLERYKMRSASFFFKNWMSSLRDIAAEISNACMQKASRYDSFHLCLKNYLFKHPFFSYYATVRTIIYV